MTPVLTPLTGRSQTSFGETSRPEAIRQLFSPHIAGAEDDDLPARSGSPLSRPPPLPHSPTRSDSGSILSPSFNAAPGSRTESGLLLPSSPCKPQLDSASLDALSELRQGLSQSAAYGSAVGASNTVWRSTDSHSESATLRLLAPRFRTAGARPRARQLFSPKGTEDDLDADDTINTFLSSLSPTPSRSGSDGSTPRSMRSVGSSVETAASIGHLLDLEPLLITAARETKNELGKFSRFKNSNFVFGKKVLTSMSEALGTFSMERANKNSGDFRTTTTSCNGMGNCTFVSAPNFTFRRAEETDPSETDNAPAQATAFALIRVLESLPRAGSSHKLSDALFPARGEDAYVPEGEIEKTMRRSDKHLLEVAREGLRRPGGSHDRECRIKKAHSDQTRVESVTFSRTMLEGGVHFMDVKIVSGNRNFGNYTKAHFKVQIVNGDSHEFGGNSATLLSSSVTDKRR